MEVEAGAVWVLNEGEFWMLSGIYTDGVRQQLVEVGGDQG
jgi:hypothetical protein